MDHKQISLGGINKMYGGCRILQFSFRLSPLLLRQPKLMSNKRNFPAHKRFWNHICYEICSPKLSWGMYRRAECLFSLTYFKPLYQSNLKLSRHDWSFVYDSPCEWIGFELQLSPFLLRSIMRWRWSLVETVPNPSSCFARYLQRRNKRRVLQLNFLRFKFLLIYFNIFIGWLYFETF